MADKGTLSNQVELKCCGILMWHLYVAGLSASAKSLERPWIQQKCLLFCIFPTDKCTLSKLVSKEIFIFPFGTTAAVNH